MDNKEPFSIEIKRRGSELTLITISKNDHPIGSIILDPELDISILESIQETINEWNRRYREQEEKKDRIRLNLHRRDKVTRDY